MRVLYVVALLLAVQPAMAGETLHLIGGKLGPTQPVAVFTARRDHIVVTGLPANWSGSASQCHTAVPKQYPGLDFGFFDGNTTSARLRAGGFHLSTGEYGLPGTSVTICRDATGAVSTLNAQIVMIGSSGGVLELYEVAEQNTSPTAGMSASSLSGFNGQHEQTFTASSTAANTVRIVD